ncbi:MAG: DUF2218 domain-containing protein [Alphaproteobacteria bacterium]
MMQSEARVTTERASRYLQQLCKHFAHKLPTSHTPQEGRIEFGVGVCALQAEPETLVLTADAPDAESLDRLEGVVARHLERFAFRDKPEIRWVRQ